MTTPVHIRAQPGDVAPIVLLPGDPGRATRVRERLIGRFKSPGQAGRFLAVHSQVHNLFRVGRHLLRAANYRLLRNRSFETWQQVTCAR